MKNAVERQTYMLMETGYLEARKTGLQISYGKGGHFGFIR
jgi:hypothetical protein